MGTPAKDRKAQERDRMRSFGFKRFESWVHPDDFEKVSALEPSYDASVGSAIAVKAIRPASAAPFFTIWEQTSQRGQPIETLEPDGA
jgi:hypothetical protein